MNLGVTPAKWKSQVRSWEKNLWVRAHSKDTPLNDCLKREIALVELNGLNEITSSKELERMQSGNTNLRDILSTLEQLNSER